MIPLVTTDQSRPPMSSASIGASSTSDGEFEAEFDDLSDENSPKLSNEGEERSTGFEEGPGWEERSTPSEKEIENVEAEKLSGFSSIDASANLNSSEPKESAPLSEAPMGSIEISDLGVKEKAESVLPPSTTMERYLTSQLTVPNTNLGETDETLQIRQVMTKSVDPSAILQSPPSAQATMVNSAGLPIVGVFAEPGQNDEASTIAEEQSNRILRPTEHALGAGTAAEKTPLITANESGAGLVTGQRAVQDGGRDQIPFQGQAARGQTQDEKTAEVATAPSSLGANAPQNAAALPILPTMSAQTGRTLDGNVVAERALVGGESFATVEQRVLPLDRQGAAQQTMPQNPAAVAQQAREVAVQIAASAKAGRMDVMLVPEDLGRLRLTLTPAEVGHAVLIDIERPEVLEAVRRHLDVLTSAFEGAGFSNLSFSFAQQKQNDGEHGAGATTDVIDQDSVEYLPPQTIRMAATGRLDLKL